MWEVIRHDRDHWSFNVTCRNTGYTEYRFGFHDYNSAAFAAQNFQFSLTLEERQEKCRTMSQNS